MVIVNTEESPYLDECSQIQHMFDFLSTFEYISYLVLRDGVNGIFSLINSPIWWLQDGWGA